MTDVTRRSIIPLRARVLFKWDDPSQVSSVTARSLLKP
jgi:hypothetical protein